MERAREGDDLGPVGLALVVEILARHLDRQFACLGARVGEKHRIGKAERDQPVGQFLLLGDLVEVRGMPKLPRLFGQRRHQRGVRMAKRVHRNACAQIQKSAAVLFNQPGPFAFDKAQGGA